MRAPAPERDRAERADKSSTPEAERAGPKAQPEERVEHEAGSGAEVSAARATIRRADSPSATSARTLAPSADEVGNALK